MKKQGAFPAWKMLMLSLPKGIVAFITVVAGLSVSLPLSVFLIGLPLLAETFVLCARMMETERWNAESWRRGVRKSDPAHKDKPVEWKWEGWRALLAVLAQGRSYRGIGYALLQLPIGIAAFTLAVVLPASAFGLLLSPLAYQVSTRFYSFELFADDVVTNQWFPAWTAFERSWLYAGAGAVLLLLLPVLLRVAGRMYAAWILAIAGPGNRTGTQPALVTVHPPERRLPAEPQPIEYFV